ncbi:hypothetical protein CPLU01_14089 [Colletotrichum plurivorum]|uniref:Uncharacterized protein n=1 Tax=Colletotrichum plurivorum TaxID=2175906 RepID=A0A8H6JLW5_9PEZI|nr:hypothetical protein CPLU01_14089 [Colletotrichum plurivorum]
MFGGVRDSKSSRETPTQQEVANMKARIADSPVRFATASHLRGIEGASPMISDDDSWRQNDVMKRRITSSSTPDQHNLCSLKTHRDLRESGPALRLPHSQGQARQAHAWLPTYNCHEDPDATLDPVATHLLGQDDGGLTKPRQLPPELCGLLAVQSRLEHQPQDGLIAQGAKPPIIDALPRAAQDFPRRQHVPRRSIGIAKCADLEADEPTTASAPIRAAPESWRKLYFEPRDAALSLSDGEGQVKFETSPGKAETTGSRIPRGRVSHGAFTEKPRDHGSPVNRVE